MRRFHQALKHQLVWDGWLAGGKLHILAGEPGTGKTTVALSIAATISSGRTLADGSDAKVGQVPIWSGEDDAADTLSSRLDGNGGGYQEHSHHRLWIVGEKVGAFDPARWQMAGTERHDPAGEALTSAAKSTRLGVSAVAGVLHTHRGRAAGRCSCWWIRSRRGLRRRWVSRISLKEARGALLQLSGAAVGGLGFVAVAGVLLDRGQAMEEDGPGRLICRASQIERRRLWEWLQEELVTETCAA